MNLVIASKLLITLSDCWYTIELEHPNYLTLLTHLDDHSACWVNWSSSGLISVDDGALNIAKEALDTFSRDNGLESSRFWNGTTVKLEDLDKKTYRTTGMFDPKLKFMHISQWWMSIGICLQFHAAGSDMLVSEVSTLAENVRSLVAE